jgi:hypothetical protein
MQEFNIPTRCCYHSVTRLGFFGDKDPVVADFDGSDDTIL